MPNPVKPQDTHRVSNRKQNIMSDYGQSDSHNQWGGGGGLGSKNVCTKNGPKKFVLPQIDSRNVLEEVGEEGPGRGGRGVWHKALVVGSVSLWRRLLASRL